MRKVSPLNDLFLFQFNGVSPFSFLDAIEFTNLHWESIRFSGENPWPLCLFVEDGLNFDTGLV